MRESVSFETNLPISILGNDRYRGHPTQLLGTEFDLDGGN